MSLFARLLQAVRSWRRRRGGPKTVRRAGIAMEQLDHRQLLSVNFTGNVPIDFPATQSPGVVVLPDNPLVQHPSIAPAIAPIVKVSGFDISGIRVSYTPATDTLSIGLDQPQSQNQPGEVIAGDADNNGNSGTVNPAVHGGSRIRRIPGSGQLRRHRAHGGVPRLHGQRQRPDRRRLLGRAAHAHCDRPRPQKPYEVGHGHPDRTQRRPGVRHRTAPVRGQLLLQQLHRPIPTSSSTSRISPSSTRPVTGQPLTSSTRSSTSAPSAARARTSASARRSSPSSR